jgi:hypothetical protein
MMPHMFMVPHMQSMHSMQMPFSPQMQYPQQFLRPGMFMHPQMQHLQHQQMQFQPQFQQPMQMQQQPVQMQQQQQPVQMQQEQQQQPVQMQQPQAARAAHLKDILAEAARIQTVKSTMQQNHKYIVPSQQRELQEPDLPDDDRLIQPCTADVTTTQAGIAGTPREAAASEVSEPPLAEIQDLNLTPEELESLFEDFELPNLG